jgi:sugar lactone lactonase YvrE
MQAIAGTPAVFAECPVWLPGPGWLCWIDCAAGRLLALDWSSRRVIALLERPGLLFAGLVRWDAERLLLLTAAGALRVDLDGRASDLPLPAGIDPARGNDGKCDRAGRLWLGSVGTAPGRSDGRLHRLDATGAAAAVAGLGIPNGPAFDRPGTTMFLADSLAGTVSAYPLDPAGRPGALRALLSCVGDEGAPDGMTVDAAGRLIVALFDGGALLRLDPVSGAAERIAMPVEQPTSCTFAGPNLDMLLVTVANGRWPADRRNPGRPSPDPDRPSLYVVRVPVGGIAEPDCRWPLPLQEDPR